MNAPLSPEVQLQVKAGRAWLATPTNEIRPDFDRDRLINEVTGVLVELPEDETLAILETIQNNVHSYFVHRLDAAMLRADFMQNVLNQFREITNREEPTIVPPANKL